MIERLRDEALGLKVGRLLLDADAKRTPSRAAREERLGRAYALALAATRDVRRGVVWRPEVDLAIAASDLVRLHREAGRVAVAFALGLEACAALAASEAQVAPWFFESELVLSLVRALVTCLEAPELVLPSLDEVELLLTLEEQIHRFRTVA